jgi:predicted methyltransferase
MARQEGVAMPDKIHARLVAAVCFVLCGLVAAAARAADTQSAIAAAVADGGRPDADVQRDVLRKPVQTLAFAGVKPGDSVGELLPGAGYYTRLLSKLVGPTGHVYALAPPRPTDASPETPDFAARVKAIAADPRYANVSVVLEPLTDVVFPKPLDLVWTSQNYHDFHNVPHLDLPALNRQVFDALKPGGVYLILDHAAAPGSADRDTSTLHRIDPETVKKEVLAAGFVLEASSDLLHSAQDPHTANVFDSGIRGKTDQFILKFRKPASAR